MSDFILRIDDALLDSLRKGTSFPSDEEMLRHVVTMAIYRSETVTPASGLIHVSHKLEIKRTEP